MQGRGIYYAKKLWSWGARWLLKKNQGSGEKRKKKGKRENCIKVRGKMPKIFPCRIYVRRERMNLEGRRENIAAYWIFEKSNYYHGLYIRWLLMSHNAHIWSKSGISICWRHLVTSKESSNPIFFRKRHILHHTCAACSEPPS